MFEVGAKDSVAELSVFLCGNLVKMPNVIHLLTWRDRILTAGSHDQVFLILTDVFLSQRFTDLQFPHQLRDYCLG